MKRTFSRGLVAAAAAIATVSTIAGCAPTATDEDVDRTLTLAVDSLVSAGWDPAQGSFGWDTEFAQQAVFDSLVRYDGNGDVIPVLAEGYELADDRLSIEIKLREDVDFVDGEHMDAAGVEKFYDNLLGPDSAYLGKSVMEPLGLEFTATGEYTLELTSTLPIFHPESFTWDPVRLLFMGIAILSPAAVDDPELALAEPLGSGPYVIDERDSDVEITFVRNPDYWNPDAYPYDTIVLKVIADPIAKLNALKSGQVDAASIAVEYAAEAESAGLSLAQAAPTFYTMMIRDVENSTLEPLRDVRVRQAMSMSFDREAIAETLDLGFGRASSQAFVPGQPEYIDGGDERYVYDLDRARELMADAGYADGFDLAIPTSGADASVEPIIAQSLGDIGIRVRFEQQADVTAFFQASMGGAFPVAMLAIGNIDVLRFIDQEVAGFGKFFEVPAEVAALIETIKYGDPADGPAASQDLGEVILDEVWYIPFSRPAKFWGSDATVTVSINDVTPILLPDFGVAE